MDRIEGGLLLSILGERRFLLFGKIASPYFTFPWGSQRLRNGKGEESVLPESLRAEPEKLLSEAGELTDEIKQYKTGWEFVGTKGNVTLDDQTDYLEIYIPKS